jgi:aminoglycoside 6'-N-acetyltransferase
MQPHWQEWWDDPEIEVSNIEKMVAGEDTTRPFIFLIDAKPAGFIQYWFLGHQQNQAWIDSYPFLAALPNNTIGVDISIANTSDLGKGIGSKVLRKFAKTLKALGYKSIVIDPHPKNIRAIKAYEKAGFITVESLRDKTKEMLIMAFEPETVPKLQDLL